jgi:hypothetical protein
MAEGDTGIARAGLTLIKGGGRDPAGGVEAISRTQRIWEVKPDHPSGRYKMAAVLTNEDGFQVSSTKRPRLRLIKGGFLEHQPEAEQAKPQYFVWAKRFFSRFFKQPARESKV